MQNPPSENHAALERRETLEARAQRVIDEELPKGKGGREDLAGMPKGAPLKVKIAERLHKEMPMTLSWTAETLEMGREVYFVSTLQKTQGISF